MKLKIEFNWKELKRDWTFWLHYSGLNRKHWWNVLLPHCMIQGPLVTLSYVNKDGKEFFRCEAKSISGKYDKWSLMYNAEQVWYCVLFYIRVWYNSEEYLPEKPSTIILQNKQLEDWEWTISEKKWRNNG